MGKENSSPWNWNYYFWLLKSADRHWHSDCFSTSLNLLENFAETWGYSCQTWETIGGFCQIKWIWPAVAINLHPPHRDSPPTLGTTGWITHTYMPPYTSSSPKLFSDFSPNHNFKQIQSGLARCPRKDKVSPEQLYFHIKRPLKYSFTRTRHTHTLVTSCDDSVSTLSLNLVP